MASSSFTGRDSGERMNRFIQLQQDGIIMYDEKSVKETIKQFNEMRWNKYDDILEELKRDLRANQYNMTNYWTEAKNLYEKNPHKYKSALKMEDGEDFPDECHIALICYTFGGMTTGPFADFNRECRDVCSGKLKFYQIKNRSFFFLLTYVLEKKKEDFRAKVYRGCRGKFETAKSEDVKGFGQFTSTTYDIELAEEFAANGTLFEIGITEKSRLASKVKYVNMAYHSIYPEEREVLLSPFQLYFIRDVKETKEYDVVSLIIY